MTAAPLRLRRRRVRGRGRAFGFHAYLVVSLLVGFAALAALLVDVFRDGISHLDARLLTEVPSTLPELAGARPAVLATFYLMALLIVLTIPIGVGTAIYLEEYANKERWYNRLLEINIQNLAALPSIVYGILSFAFLVRGLGLGRVLLAGAMILSLLVLPIVIIAAREAIRAVPSSIRDGSLALGASKWQTIWRQILPAAIPGIATGSILALSRAIGEAAPLLLLGAVTFVAFNPDSLTSAYTVLPIQIYDWIRQSREEFQVLAAAAIVVLLAILLLMNSLAIYIRNRYQKRW